MAGMGQKKTDNDTNWDQFGFTIDDATPEEARAFVRLLNTPGGRAFLQRSAESLIALRRAAKRRRYVVPLAPIVDPRQLPFLLTVAEVAALLRVGVDGVYSRVERGELTGLEGLIREGTRIAFHRDRLIAWLERAGEPRKRGGRR
jgi:excisionase family DNA binding protein